MDNNTFRKIQFVWEGHNILLSHKDQLAFQYGKTFEDVLNAGKFLEFFDDYWYDNSLPDMDGVFHSVEETFDTIKDILYDIELAWNKHHKLYVTWLEYSEALYALYDAMYDTLVD